MEAIQDTHEQVKRATDNAVSQDGDASNLASMYYNEPLY